MARIIRFPEGEPEMSNGYHNLTQLIGAATTKRELDFYMKIAEDMEKNKMLSKREARKLAEQGREKRNLLKI